jgi:uncharacterized membrane-anchored protein YitT (DUF2179 family)
VIDVESQYLWKRTKSASACWLFAIRYGALATNIPVLVFSLVTLPKKVSILEIYGTTASHNFPAVRDNAQ